MLLTALWAALNFTAIARAEGDPAGQANTVRTAVAQIISKADSGDDTSSLVLTTADLGIGAAVECARHIQPDHPARNAVLMEIIAQAGQSRRSNPELLKLYDPAAYQLYYLDAGIADQKVISKALALKAWPRKLPEAMVRAAPRPTLEWMLQQSKAERPPVEKLRLLWQTWGFWVRAGHERQFAGELHSAAAELAKSRALLADEETVAVLVRFAGEVRSHSATPFIIEQLAHGPVAVRAEAATACGRLGSEPALVAFEQAGHLENDPFVQQKIAGAAEAWPARADVGEMLLELFNRTKSPAVRRESLFSCGESTWPARADLLVRAFDLPDNGVLGAALIELASKPEPKALDRVLEVADQIADAEPPLIDALGAYSDSHAVPHLLRWLAKQENPVVRVKLVLAIEKTALKHEADALLLKLLQEDPSAMVVEQLEGIVSRKQIAGAQTILAALAKDTTAPLQLRIAAIAALGHFDQPDVRKVLKEIERDAETLFKGSGGRSGDSEVLDMVRLTTALANIHLREPTADAQLQAAFDRSTSLGQLTALVGLAQIGRDHPIIAQSLVTTDTAVLFGAVRAAAASNPAKYHDDLVRLRHAPFIDALLNSGLDSANLRPALDAAIEKGKEK